MKYIKEKEKERLTDRISILLFQICVILDSLFGFNETLYRLSKGFMLFFFIWMILYELRKGYFELRWTFIYPFLFTLLSALSILWAVNSGTATAQFNTQLQLFILFFFTYTLFLDEEKYIKKYFDALYISGVCMAIYALYSYGIIGYIEALGKGIRMGRAITNENLFGMTFAWSALVAFYYYLKNKKMLHLVCIVVFAFFAFSSGSKKASLMIPFGIIGMCTLKYGIRKMWKTILISVVSIGVFLLIIRQPMFSNVYERLSSFFSRDYNVSDATRAKMIEVGLQLFRQRPILGYGIGNYTRISGMGGYSHNNYIEVLVSTGLLGFALYYIPYIRALYWGFKEKVMNGDNMKTLLLVFAFLSIVFGYGMVQIYDKNCWLMYAVILACADSVTEETKE